jgi:imidazolonepropionase-like amidohydrolase
MKANNLVWNVLLVLSCASVWAQNNGVLFTGGTIHTGTGIVIENAVMGIRAGKIEFVGDGKVIKYDRKAYAEQIDFSGQHLYPGLIAMNSSIGLREIDAVRATLDYNEVGDLNPHIRSLPAFNTDSRIIPTVRSNGVLTVQACPTGGTISGSSSVFHLNGWNWEDALVQADDGIHLFWPEHPLAKLTKDSSKTNRTLRKQTEIIDLMLEAAAYGKGERKERNLKLQALQGLFSGNQRLYVHCHRARGIADAVIMLHEAGIQKIVVVGAEEAALVAGLLRKFGVPVVLPRVHRLPDFEDDAVDAPFSLPAVLRDSGLTVALTYDGEMEAMGTRNLAFTAGTAAAYGCGKEDALKMISLNPAKILGIDERTGSIEPGKAADFFVSTGDALDPISCTIVKIYIDGIGVSLSNHQSELNKKYREKYKLSGK